MSTQSAPAIPMTDQRGGSGKNVSRKTLCPVAAIPENWCFWHGKMPVPLESRILLALAPWFSSGIE
jgi:hypothetical protein